MYTIASLPIESSVPPFVLNELITYEEKKESKLFIARRLCDFLFDFHIGDMFSSTPKQLAGAVCNLVRCLSAQRDFKRN